MSTPTITIESSITISDYIAHTNPKVYGWLRITAKPRDGRDNITAQVRKRREDGDSRDVEFVVDGDEMRAFCEAYLRAYGDAQTQLNRIAGAYELLVEPIPTAPPPI